MTSIYDKHGVQFQYPENWALSEDAKEWPREVSVESPTGAFWSLQIYAPPDDPARLVAGVLQAMQQEYEELEDEPVQEQLQSVVAEGHDMSFFCREFLVSCRTRSFTLHDTTYLLIAQAEDREFDKLEPVFRAMTTSLIRSLQAAP